MGSTEHLKYGGSIVRATITWVMNSIIWSGIIPVSLKKGLLVPIPKPNKDQSIKDNNRGITLLPSLYKLFEKLIIHRETHWLSSSKVCDDIQSCGKANCSSMHTSFVVQEAIAYNVSRGETVYGAFLDTKKAFDTVWVKGLLYKLYNSGINKRVWLLIRNSYKDFMCASMIGGMIGKWFCPQRGVHQGAPLSMQLYTIYINDLLTKIQENRYGLYIGDINVTCPAHADDICILSIFKTGLNELMKIADEYSYKWRYLFNHSKTVVVIWGKDRQPHTQLKFRDDIIQPQSISKHMGITLYNDLKLEREICAKRIGAARQVIYCAKGLGSSQVPVDTMSLSRIYWAVGIPKMTYGLDIVPLSDQCLNDLEKAHRHHARLIQDIPENTPKPAVLATLGWLSIGSYLSILQIMFMIRVLCLPSQNIYRKIMVHQLSSLRMQNIEKLSMRSPVLLMYKKAKQYGLENCVIKCLTSGNLSMIPYYKHIVKHTIWERENVMWKASAMMYKELGVYLKCISAIKILPWWLYAQKCPHHKVRISCIIAVLMGSQPKGMQRNIGKKKCHLCGMSESPKHILFECPKLVNPRTQSWEGVLGVMPHSMMIDVDQLNMADKTAFILSGMNSASFIVEWADIYYQIANFVYSVYKTRMLLYDEMG